MLIRLLLVFAFLQSAVLAWPYWQNNACPKLWMYPFAAFMKECHFNPDIGQSPAFMAQRRGYPAATYHITTDDGYMLDLFRIKPKNYDPTTVKSPIIIQGEMMSNSDYFTGAGDRSLAFNLADLGHEVFLGNLRGTTYGAKHKTLTVDNKKFWDFNWDNLKLDVRAQLKFVSNITASKGSIIYMGHCLGNSLLYIYSIEYPEEAAELVQGTVSLSPANFLDHSKFFKPLVPVAVPVLKTLKMVGINGIFYQEAIIHNFLRIFFQFVPHFGKGLLDFIFGKSAQFPVEDLLMMWTNFIPCGTSVDELLHLFQISKTGKFSKFDYGKRKNLKLYNSPQPPEYDLSKMTIPAYLFYGTQDKIADAKDAQRTFKALGSTKKEIFEVPRNNTKYAFSHFDFVNGLYVKKFLYDDLLFPVIEKNFT